MRNASRPVRSASSMPSQAWAISSEAKYINGARTHEHLGDFQRLLTGIRLGDQEVVHVHPKAFCVRRIQGMLRVDKSGHTARLLGFGNGL